MGEAKGGRGCEGKRGEGQRAVEEARTWPNQSCTRVLGATTVIADVRRNLRSRSIDSKYQKRGLYESTSNETRVARVSWQSW